MTARRLTLLLGEVITIVVVLGLLAAHAARHGYSVDADERFVWTLAYLVMLLLAVYAVGLPDQTGRRGPIAASALACGAAAVAISLCQLAAGSALLPRFVVFASAALIGGLWALIGVFLQARAPVSERVSRVMFVGSPRDGAALEADLARAPERASVMVASLPVDEARPIGMADEPLVDLAIDDNVSVLVLGRTAQTERLLISQASTLHEAGVRVRTLAEFYEEWLGKLPVSELERTSLMFDISELHEAGYARVKRMLDIAAGVVGLIPFVLAIPFVLVGNVVANRGSLFYRQPRTGRDGKTFRIIKFRTMRKSDSMEWTAENDPRITRFGRILRRTHIDELPQFVNILRGELSIVGPRPEQPQYVEQLVECVPYYKLRHLVRPGLTGWAQVKYGYAGDEHDALEKLQYDIYYLGHQSLALDVRVIARTVRSMAGGNSR